MSLVLDSDAVTDRRLFRKVVEWACMLLLGALALLAFPNPLKSPNTFPIGVWLQSPQNATRYRAIGINLYVGLWQGPTQKQVDDLEKAEMPVVCLMNDWAKEHRSSKVIVGWMHDDEPDNAQALPGGKGYGPPILPERIVEDYRRIKTQDPSRPVLLNLGQAVAWDGWIGRGVRSRHPEDYVEYVKGCDIASFDIYPVTSPPPVQGDLGFVGVGTRRLRSWSTKGQSVWACIEATHIGNANVKPTPDQTRKLVWQAVIHGATGIVYFSHQFAPTFIEAGILADSEMSAGISNINRQLQELAPVIKGPNAPKNAVVPRNPAPVDFLVKQKGNQRYLFATSMSPNPCTAEFACKGEIAEVIGENRKLSLRNGGFTDRFLPYEVHLYRLK